MTFKTKVDWKEEISAIRQRGAEGESMASIARSYSVSTQRIQQVISRYIPNWYAQYGRAVEQLRKAQESFDKWGNYSPTTVYKEQKKKFRTKKSNAIRLGIPWDIKFGHLTWPTHCPILGIELDYFNEKRAENSPSFDRVNPNLGYVTGNVMIISYRANRIKNDGTAEEHRAIADWMSGNSTTNK